MLTKSMDLPVVRKREIQNEYHGDYGSKVVNPSYVRAFAGRHLISRILR